MTILDQFWGVQGYGVLVRRESHLCPGLSVPVGARLLVAGLGEVWPLGGVAAVERRTVHQTLPQTPTAALWALSGENIYGIMLFQLYHLSHLGFGLGFEITNTYQYDTENCDIDIENEFSA